MKTFPVGVWVFSDEFNEIRSDLCYNKTRIGLLSGSREIARLSYT